jgi:hypothetical protein
MDLEAYRERARACRIEASRSTGEIEKYFLQTAEVWENLADRLERIEQMGTFPKPQRADQPHRRSQLP